MTIVSESFLSKIVITSYILLKSLLRNPPTGRHSLFSVRARIHELANRPPLFSPNNYTIAIYVYVMSRLRVDIAAAFSHHSVDISYLSRAVSASRFCAALFRVSADEILRELAELAEVVKRIAYHLVGAGQQTLHPSARSFARADSAQSAS